MSNIISTWIYEDKIGEETLFPQSGHISSSEEHKAIYWRCVYMFFVFASKYIKTDCKFVLFTNYSKPQKFVDNIDILSELSKINVQIIVQDFTYKLPKGYYGSWGNQLYEFNILKRFIIEFPESNLLMLDSDCIITKDISSIFDILKTDEAITLRGKNPEEYEGIPLDKYINGITERQMTQLYNELNPENPKNHVPYCCGEFFCAKSSFIKKVMDEFDYVYKNMIDRFLKTNDPKTVKYNEEAHFLSYFYAKYNIPIGKADTYIKRMWIMGFYNTVYEGDENYPIWHLVNGKAGYSILIKKVNKGLLKKNQTTIIKALDKIFLHPKLPLYKIIIKKIILKIKKITGNLEE